MISNDEIEVQPLRTARVHGVHGEPGTVVLQMCGCGDSYYSMTVEELTSLAARLTTDARLLSTTSETGISPS